MKTLHCGRWRLPLEGRPLLMAIVNLTDDSFSGDGLGDNVAAAVKLAGEQCAAGADILDLGAESTRPGAEPVATQTQLARLLPLLRELRDWPTPLSVDSADPQVMRAAIDAGAALINDTNALRAPAALPTVAASDVGVCLMHMQGAPRNMQQRPHYTDVVAEVHDFLAGRIAACVAAGIDRQRLLVDPGFGFGKTLAHNYTLLRELPQLADLGAPLLAGMSRKSMLAAVSGGDDARRTAASVAAALLAAQRGAAVLRVHDVAATRDALAVWRAMENPPPQPTPTPQGDASS